MCSSNNQAITCSLAFSWLIWTYAAGQGCGARWSPHAALLDGCCCRCVLQCAACMVCELKCTPA
jgi:hypothetical protein